MTREDAGSDDVPRQTSATSVSDSGLSDWLTKQQAAAAIGVSTKAIERFAQARRLEQRSRPQARGPHVAVYHPDDVARLASERRVAPSPFVLPADAAPAGNGQRPSPSAGPASTDIGPVLATGDDPLRALFAAALRAVLSQTSETASVSETSFVTIKEAAALTGLSQAYLRRAITEQKLPAIRDRGWRIRRKDLEAL